MVQFDKVSELGRLETGSCYVAKDNEEVMRNHLKIRLRCRNKNMLAKEATKLQSEINYIRGFLIPVHNVDYSSEQKKHSTLLFETDAHVSIGTELLQNNSSLTYR